MTKIKKILIVFGTRPEALEAGTVKLVGTDAQLIVKDVQEFIHSSEAYELMSKVHNPYGNDHDFKKIINFLR